MEALVNTKMMVWALERSERDPQDVAKALKVKPEKLEAWLNGELKPKFKQAQNFAHQTRVPFGYLYLNEPPKESIPVPEFRSLPNAQKKLDAVTLDVLRDVQGKIEWYREYLKSIEVSENIYVGRAAGFSSDMDIAADIRTTLIEHGAKLDRRVKSKDLFNSLVQALENMHIWVMRSGYVGGNTRRTIDLSSFRGFAISDKLAPLIFINTKDAEAAKVFTLMHELAHIWFGKSDLAETDTLFDAGTETRCNKIAAEVLMPQAVLRDSWRYNEPIKNQIEDLKSQFGTSALSIAIRARQVGLIDQTELNEFQREFYQEFRQNKKNQLNGSGGPGPQYAVPARCGRAFTQSVVAEAMAGNLMLRDASALLHVKPTTIIEKLSV